MRGAAPDNFFYRLACFCAPLVNSIFLGRVESANNIPARGPVILAANHVSFPDGWLIANIALARRGASPWFIGRDDYWVSARWTRFAMSRLTALFIDWRNPGAVLEEARDVLGRGGAIGVFPEGTRNMNAEALVLGKTGAARLALATGAPVIPIGYRGPSVTTTWEGFKHFLFKRNTAVITIGKPMRFGPNPNPAREVTREALYEATDKIMIEIGKLCGKRARLHTV